LPHDPDHQSLWASLPVPALIVDAEDRIAT
jgi:hypothetical protein